MKVTIFKHGQQQNEVDFYPEIIGLGSDEVRFFLGRSEDCHLFLDDKMISRKFAELIFKNNSWKIKKLSSTGDVFLNGQNITEHELHNLDVIKVGDYNLSVELNEVVDEIQVPPTDTFSQIDDDFISTPPITNDSFSESTATHDNINLDELSNNNENKDSEFALENGDFAQEELSEGKYAEEGYEGEYSEEGYGDSYEEGYNEGYGEEGGYALDALDDEKTGIIQSFAKYKLEIFGENAPYDTYELEEGETFIGRNPEKCQVVLSDPEVSSVHAVVKKVGSVCQLEDLQSGNGTLYKGERINKVSLENGEEFIIGSTTFTLRVGSDFLMDEKETFMPVEENQEIEVEEIIEIDPNLEDGFDVNNDDNEKSIIKRIMKDPEKRKRALIGLVLLLAVYVLIGDDSGSGGKKVQKPQNQEAQKNDDKNDPLKSLSPAKREKINTEYLLAKEMIEIGKHTEGLDHLAEVHKIMPTGYKKSKQLEDLAKNSLATIAELEKKKQEEIAKKIKQEKIKTLVEKAKVAVQERNVLVAEKIFDQVSELDPNNFDIPLLKSELDAWKKEEERKKIEEAQKKAERQRKVESLKPGKNYWLKKEWYKAILELEKFMDIKEMDDDLTTEANKMLEESQTQLKLLIDPIVGKARSLAEGQDLKGAYEEYKRVLKYDPSHGESLNEMNRIKEILHIRARKIYREAILSESLSLFEQAKEKFQELQQVAPTDSEYYEKATEKLKEYID